MAPYLYKKFLLWPLFWNTWRLLSYFLDKRGQICYFLLKGQNLNYLKV